MGDLSWTRAGQAHAPWASPIEDLNELYWRTKAAEACAEASGFPGMAAALSDIASAMAALSGVDRELVERLRDKQVLSEDLD